MEEKVKLVSLYSWQAGFWVESLPVDPQVLWAPLKATVICAIPGNRSAPSSTTESVHRTALTLCVLGDTDEQAHAPVPGWAPLVSPDPDIQSYGLVGTLETIRQRLAAYEAAGVQELVISFFDTPQLETMRRFASSFLQ